MRDLSDSADADRLTDSVFNWTKEEHPNVLLRFYGNVMGAIGSFFLRLAMPYMTVYELDIDWDEEEDELEDDTI